MSFSQSYVDGWKNALNFRGKSTRQQFWSFFFGNLFIGLVPLACWLLVTLSEAKWGVFIFFVVPPVCLFAFILIVPVLTLGIRRMHDTGRSGWWFTAGMLVPWFLPVSLALCCLPSRQQ